MGRAQERKAGLRNLTNVLWPRRLCNTLSEILHRYSSFSSRSLTASHWGSINAWETLSSGRQAEIVNSEDVQKFDPIAGMAQAPWPLSFNLLTYIRNNVWYFQFPGTPTSKRKEKWNSVAVERTYSTSWMMTRRMTIRGRAMRSSLVDSDRYM